MGCCHSASHHDSSSPDATGRPAPSNPATATTAINPVSGLIPSTAARPNAPLRTPSPLRKHPWPFPNQPWTRKRLQTERRDYFDTRVSGHAEVWDALRVVCDLMRQGRLMDAQGIMDAANLTCPSGRVVYDRRKERDKADRGGVFDDRGMLYDIPAWLVVDPVDLEVDEDEHSDDGGGAEKDGVDETDPGKVEHSTEDAVRADKGKGRLVDVGESLTLRARLSNTGLDLSVTMGAKEKVGAVVARMREQLGNPREVRLLYLGRRMETDKTLEQQGWQRGHVVNALVLSHED